MTMAKPCRPSGAFSTVTAPTPAFASSTMAPSDFCTNAVKYRPISASISPAFPLIGWSINHDENLLCNMFVGGRGGVYGVGCGYPRRVSTIHRAGAREGNAIDPRAVLASLRGRGAVDSAVDPVAGDFAGEGTRHAGPMGEHPAVAADGCRGLRADIAT